MQNNSMFLNGYKILVAGTWAPFSNMYPNVPIQGLIESLKNRGALVDLMQIPFHAIDDEAVLRTVTAWSLFDFTGNGNDDYTAVITTSFPSFHLSHPRKIVWWINGASYILNHFFSDSSLISLNEQNNFFILQKLLKKTLSSSKAVFVSRQTIEKNLSEFIGVKSNYLSVLPREFPENTSFKIENEANNPLHLLISFDETSHSSVVLFLKHLAELDFPLSLTFICDKLLSLTLKGELAENNFALETEIMTDYTPPLWDKCLKNSNLIIDFRKIKGINPLLLEAAHWEKTFFINEESDWSIKVIEKTKTGNIFNNEFKNLLSFIEILHNNRNKSLFENSSWNNYFTSSWDVHLKKLLSPILGGKIIENSFL